MTLQRKGEQAPMSNFIRTQREGRVVTLTLDRPAMRNAIGSHDDCAEIVDAVERAAADPGVAALVITGAGSAFCAGRDGGAYFLPRAVGWSKAAEMMFTGEPLSAEEGLACGLVSRVVPAGDVLAEAQALAQRIAANPPQTLRLVKRLLREAQHARLPEV